jgi:hypothetical protein
MTPPSRRGDAEMNRRSESIPNKDGRKYEVGADLNEPMMGAEHHVWQYDA